MKNFLSFLLAALVAPAAVYAAAFEGKVTMKMTDPHGKSQAIDYSLKSGFARIEMPMNEGVQGVMIMDLNKKEMLMLMPEQQMYMVIPIPEPTERPGATEPDNDITLEKTGEKEKILGYECEKYLSKSKDTTTELWLTEQLGSFVGLGGPTAPGLAGRGQGSHQAWERLLRGKELFPLRAVGKSAAGKETFRLEVTAIEKKSLPDHLFVPPDDYQRMDMGNMMHGMGMGGPSGPPRLHGGK